MILVLVNDNKTDTKSFIIELFIIAKSFIHENWDRTICLSDDNLFLSVFSQFRDTLNFKDGLSLDGVCRQPYRYVHTCAIL